MGICNCSLGQWQTTCPRLARRLYKGLAPKSRRSRSLASTNETPRTICLSAGRYFLWHIPRLPARKVPAPAACLNIPSVNLSIPAVMSCITISRFNAFVKFQSSIFMRIPAEKAIIPMPATIFPASIAPLLRRLNLSSLGIPHSK